MTSGNVVVHMQTILHERRQSFVHTCRGSKAPVHARRLNASSILETYLRGPLALETEAWMVRDTGSSTSLVCDFFSAINRTRSRTMRSTEPADGAGNESPVLDLNLRRNEKRAEESENGGEIKDGAWAPFWTDRNYHAKGGRPFQKLMFISIIVPTRVAPRIAGIRREVK